MTSRLAIPTSLARAVAIAVTLLAAWPAAASTAQSPTDQSDASVLSEEVTEGDRARAEPGRTPVLAPSSRNDVMPSLRPFVAGAIHVEGAIALSAAAFSRAVEPYLGRSLDRDDLASLARDVAGVARAAGYGLATAWVPPQRVTNGILRVRVDEGRIDAIEAEGPAGPAAERLLRRLAGGAPVRTADLERQLLLAGDLSGVTMGQARLDRSGGRNVLRVDTAISRSDGRFSLDNWGNAAVGPLRARVNVDVNGVRTIGDQLSVGGAVTPAQPGEFQFIQAGYSTPLGADGVRVSVRGYISRSSAGGAIRNRDLEGESAEIEAGISYPLIRSRARSLWGYLNLGLRDSQLTRADVPAREDRIATLTASLYGWAYLAGGTSRTRLSLVQGLGVLGATERGDPLASRRDASGKFSKVAFWMDYIRRLGGGFSLQLSGEGQIASRPLLASEEMGLGGRAFLRGYDYRQQAGDSGAAAAAEVRFDLTRLPAPLRRVQLFTYVDGGRVTNLRGGMGGGSLASAGGGFRLWLNNRMEAGLELGVPLSEDAPGRRSDPRLSFSIGGRF